MTEENAAAFKSKALCFVKRPLFIFLVIGLAARFILAPLLTYEYDMYHWGVIMQNINSGNELYELTGYFYLPVWGYIMGFIALIWNLICSIDIFGVASTALIPMTDLSVKWHLVTITSPGFNVAMKIPLIICDLAVGYLLYKVIYEFTGSKKKSEYAFGIWFLCPIVLYMTGVQGMFDNISALFTLLFVVLVMKDHYFLAGLMFALAALLKLFPGAAILILVIYVLFKSNTKNDGIRNLMLAIVGALAGVALIMVPTLVQGNLEYALTFITDRSSRNGLINSLPTILMVVLELLLAYIFYKGGRKDLDKRLVTYTIVAMVISFLAGLNPQYVIVLVPLMIIYIFTISRDYSLPLALIGIGFTLFAMLQDNFSLLSSISVFYGWVSEDWIVSCMQALDTTILSIPIVYYLMSIGYIIGFVGLALIIFYFIEAPLTKKYPSVSKYYGKLRSIGHRTEVSDDA